MKLSGGSTIQHGRLESYYQFATPINLRLESDNHLEFDIIPPGESSTGPLDITRNVAIPGDKYHFL